jgi:two-component system, cell cycle response regulator
LTPRAQLPDASFRPTRILLVEEDHESLESLRESLAQVRDARFEIEWAGELATALQRLSLGGVDIVLLDLALPDSEGLVTFERCYAFAPDVPIIVLTSMDDEGAGMSTVQGGAQDYLVKALVDGNVLVRSIRYAIERHRLLAALRSLSLIDDLTALYNRRGFSDLGEQHLKLARRSARSVTLVYVDLDQFKRINDALGHHVGDRALMKVAEILRTSFRRSDIIARLGGDDFAVLALEATGEDSELLMTRLRGKVEYFNRTEGEPYELSISIGIARFDDGSRVRLDDLLSRADADMYDEKRKKRKEVSP